MILIHKDGFVEVPYEDAHFEKWVTVSGFPNYEVSNYGRVRSEKKKGKVLLKMSISGYGASTVRLSKEGVAKTTYVHRLVADAFLGLDLLGDNLVVIHINGNKLDNRVENLRIDSRESTFKRP